MKQTFGLIKYIQYRKLYWCKQINLFFKCFYRLTGLLEYDDSVCEFIPTTPHVPGQREGQGEGGQARLRDVAAVHSARP